MNIISYFKKTIHRALRRAGYRVYKIGPYSIFDFESFLYQYLETHKLFTFMQIGANDGVMNDSIYDFNLKNKLKVSGFVLEPLPDIFNKLVKNYQSCPDIKPRNIAIHATEHEMEMYRVKPKYVNQLPDFAKGIASFNPVHWRKTMLVPNASFIEKVKVKCLSFSEFISQEGINTLDLLLIDTEGYDYDIIMSIDFQKIRPKIIRFEHGVRNEVMSCDNLTKLCNHLNSFGYQIIAESYDATAYLLEPRELIF